MAIIITIRMKHCFMVRISYTLNVWSYRMNRLQMALKGNDYVGGDPAAGSPTATLLRLLPPCKPQIRHDPKERASPKAHSDGATGGVCKEQGRIHRAMMTRGY